MLFSRLSRIEAIILDLEDTLFSRAEWAIPALEHAAAVIGLDRHRVWELASNYVREQGHAGANIYNHVLLGCGQSDSVMNIKALITAVNDFKPAPSSMQLFPGAIETIIALSGRYKLAILADGPVESQEAIINGLGLKSACSAVIFSDMIAGPGSRRPDPRPYYAAMDALKIRGKNIAFVGDNPIKDFIRAKRLGLLTIRVHTGEYADYPYPAEEYAADYDISSIAVLPDLMTKGAGQGIFLRKNSE